MDRSRINTTLEGYADSGELADQLRREAAEAIRELSMHPHFEESIARVVREFRRAAVRRAPGLADEAELISWAFRSGLLTGLSIGAVGEPDWGL